MAGKKLPVLLAVGASDMVETERAVATALAINPDLCLLQCNTNYTGSATNFAHVNLNVLRTFGAKWPDLPLGLSDHTPGHAAVLGAVALGARVIEKHFTDDNAREGPDHAFSLNPLIWREMVERTRELEAALGDGVKRCESNEQESAIVQRRALRFVREMNIGEEIVAHDLEPLRPCPKSAFAPWRIEEAIGRVLCKPVVRGEAVSLDLFE